MFKLWHKYQEEVSEGGEGFGGEEIPQENSGEETEPSFFLRDLSEDDAYNSMLEARRIPEYIDALESRVNERVSPVFSRLEELQRNAPTQVGFTPGEEFKQVEQVLRDFDPGLADKFMPALLSALGSSIKTSPLDSAALSPHISPQLSSLREEMDRSVTLGLLDLSDINPSDYIPPINDQNQWVPSSATHKEFINWYNRQDVSTRTDLSHLGVGFVRALKKFQTEYNAKIQDKEKSVGEASSRLNASQQVKSGRAAPQTEEDPFLAGFKSVMAERAR